MKTFALLIASTAAVTSAEIPGCDIARLLPIFTGSNAKACTSETGFTPFTFAVPPVEQLRNVCTNARCGAFFLELATAVPTECVLATIPLKAGFLDLFPPACASALADPTATSKPTPAPTTSEPTVTPKPTPAPKTA